MSSHRLPNKLTLGQKILVRIVETAARFIRNDTKSVSLGEDTSPAPEDLARLDTFVPISLRLLLRKLFSQKKADLNVQFSCPSNHAICPTKGLHCIPPVRPGSSDAPSLRIKVPLLVDSLSSHGFCVSYAEAKTFEMCAAESQ